MTSEMTAMQVLVFSESREVAEKKILICLLAMREAERLGLVITDEDVQRTSDDFRRRFGLEDGDAAMAWMKDKGLELTSYTQFMRFFATVGAVQASLKGEIDALIETFAKIESVRERAP